MRWLILPLVALTWLGGGTVDAPPGDCMQWANSAYPGHRSYLIDQGHPAARDDGAGDAAQPWKTLASASRRDLKRGDVVLIRGGLYRGAIRPRVSGLVIVGCPGDDVVISGSEVFNTTWTRDGDAWKGEAFRPNDGFGDRYDTNLIVADGEPLRPVSSRDQLMPGTFTVEQADWGSGSLWVRLSGERAPGEAVMEVGVRSVLFGLGSDSNCQSQIDAHDASQLFNLTFVHAANPAQTGAVCLAGDGGRIEGVTVRQTNGRGVEVWGSRHTIKDVDVSENGHLGIGGGCTDCLLERVTADRNNWRGHDPYWEAGGGKWVRTHGTVFRDFVARGNEGPGLWFDGGCTENVVYNARLLGNLVSGLQVELGSDNNRIVGSWMMGTRRDGWAAEGILIMAADGTELEGNLVQDNEGSGLWLRMDSRQRTGGLRAWNNVFVDNAAHSEGKDYQVRLEVDADQEADRAEFVWRDNVLATPRPGHMAGLRRLGHEPVHSVDASELHAGLGLQGPTRIETDTKEWRGVWSTAQSPSPNP